MTSRSLWSEVKRRNVFKVAVAYLVLSWLLIQVSDVVFPALHLPDWSVTFVLALLAIGFLPALIFSWVYELTPEGLKRESEIEPSESITSETGRRLNLITIGLVILGISFVATNHYVFEREVEPASSIGVDEVSGQVIAWEVAEDTEPYLAVLPFRAIGEDKGHIIANGLHDDLLTRLAKLGAFRVISRTSMMEYADTTKNMRQIGEELGAGYILEGTVQTSGDRLHINAQLIDAVEDRHLWAESYDQELTASNLFDIQREVAITISGQLRAKLSKSSAAVLSEIPTESTEAYMKYLVGLELRDRPYTKLNQANLEAAFQEAVAIDPQFALAWAKLADAYLRSTSYTTDAQTRDANRKEAWDAIQKAEAIDPNLLEAKLARIEHYTADQKYEKALTLLESLGQVGESSSEVLRKKARIYAMSGNASEAYQTLLKAQRLSPKSVDIASLLTLYAMWNGDCKAAELHSRTALSMAPDNADVRSDSAWYELMCTVNAKRASDLLKGVDLGSMPRLFAARLAARIERDYEHLLELAKLPISGPWSSLLAWRMLVECDALRLLNRDTEAAEVLRQASEELASLEMKGLADKDELYPLTKAFYYAMAGDQEATLEWIQTVERKFSDKEHNIPGMESEFLFDRAFILAIAGLQDEAINNLRKVFELNQYGYTFQFVDSLPKFDSLHDNPSYIALREKYGNRK
jgi:TolB-like protein/Tfp pilus assembly protein PilF